MGTTIMRWAGTGSSDATAGDVPISNPDKIITTSMSQNLALSANTNQAHATLAPTEESEWHVASQFKAGTNLGKIHADAAILGVGLVGRPFVASDSNLGDLEIFEWCPVIGGTLRTDLKQPCSVSLFKYSEVPTAHRLIGSFGGPGGRPDEDFGGLTRAQVVADNFGLAFRVRNNHATQTATYVCDQLCLIAHFETPDYDIVMSHNVTDETGVAVSGRAPFFLHANLHDSAFKNQEMMRTHIRWRLITPSNDPIEVIDRFRSGNVVVNRTRNLLTDVRGLIYACPLLEAGVYYLTAFVYEYGNSTPVASTTISINIEAASVVRYVDPIEGSDTNGGTAAGTGNAWATLDKAAASTPTGGLIYVEGDGNTYGSVATEFTQDTIAIAIRPGSGVATFENDGADPSNWGTFSGDRVFLDLRSITVADSSGNSYGGKNFAQITGDNYCIYGARGDGVGMQGFNRYGNNSTIQTRFGLIDCDFYDTPIVTYFYFIAVGNASLGFFAGSWCKSSIHASSNGFVRLGGPAANNTDASTGFSFLWCGIDGAAGIAGGGDPWSFRLNGSLIQMFECGTTGTTIGAPEHFNPGSNNAYGNYGFLAEGCCCTPTVSSQKVIFGGHSRCYRDCVFDYRTNGVGQTLAYLVTPIDMEIVNNFVLVDVNFPNGMVDDGVLPSFIHQTKFNDNIIVGATATNGPNVKAYGDGGNAGVGAGYGSGSAPSHILEFDGNYWTSDGVHADPVEVAGATGAMSLLNAEYGGTNGLSASQEADYPEADDWRPDVDATEAQTGSTIASPVDYRGIMRITSPSYLGAAAADASNPAFPAIPDAISNLHATSGLTSIVLSWTSDGSGFPQVLMRKIDEGPNAGGYIQVAVLASNVTTYEDVEN